MNRLIWALILGFSLVFTTACSQRRNLRPTENPPPCENVTEQTENLGRITNQRATVRKIEIWLPLPGAGLNENPATLPRRKLIYWVLIPERNPNQMLYPCNLPERFKSDQMGINISGILLANNPNPNDVPVTGFSPFMLTTILEQEKDPC
ncbi:MAG TPA: hypothetical protein DCM08_10765 [Microscillaceae bacterium]|nr:hypothetical protein [Microscillaceae bacterium]